MNNGYYHPYYTAYPYAAPGMPDPRGMVNSQPSATYPMAPPAYGMAYNYPQAAVAPRTANTSLLTNPRFIKGALIGAAVAYLLTNEKVQHATIKTAVKAWSLVQGGVEEMKERFRDAEAELHAGDVGDTE